MKFWCPFSALFIFGLSAFGQGIQYQAVARSSDGQVLAGQSLTIIFSVYPAGSTTIWYEEEHEVVTDAFGQFALVIGEGDPLAGDWLAVDWAAGPPDLKIQLDAGAGPIDLGRVPLQSVPHSFFAQRAAVVDQDLDDLLDVDAPAPADGQVLKFNSATGSWVPANDNVASGSSGAVNTSPRLRGDGTSANPLDLSGQGAQAGQVLKWNGSAWAPAEDAGGVNYVGGSGIAIDGNVISNAGDTDPADDITISSNAGGDLSGNFANLQLKANVVGSSEIADGSVQAVDLATGVVPSALPPTGNATGDLGGNYPNPFVTGLRGRRLADISPNNGQVLAWNGSQNRWQPASINFPAFQAGPGIGLNGNTIINTGDIDPGDDITQNTNASGDLAGRFDNLEVVGLRGRPLVNTNPGNGQVLKWNGSAWAPGPDLSGGSSFWSGNDGNIFFDGGKVGIGPGSDEPRALLDLTHQASGANPHLWLRETGETNFARINLGNKNAPEQRLWIVDARSGNGTNITPEFRILYNTATTAVTKFSMTPDRITLGGFGENIGIGLGNPSERLHVLGGIRIANTDGTGAGTIRWTGTDFEGRKGNKWVSLTGGPAWSLNSSNLFYLDGRVGIGTKTPGRLLTLARTSQAAQHQLEFRNEGNITNGNFDGIAFTQGATGSTRLASVQVNYQNNGQPDMTFNLRNESNVLYLKAGGNVGVNTGNPGARLDVNGDIRASGEVRRTSTGNANLVPVAYGNVGSDGKINTGTGNFSVVRKSTGRYEVAITGESIFFEDYIINVSIAGEPGFISYSSISGKLLVRTSNLAGIILDADRSFSFVVYKP